MTMNSTKISTEINNTSENSMLEKFTLLDILLVIAENLRMLVFGPLIAGLIAFLCVTLLPKTYVSTAILKAEQVTASLMNSASVLDPVASNLGYTQKFELDEARLKLKKQIQVNFDSKDKLLNLTVQAETPQAAQALSQAILSQTYIKSQPRDSERMRLQKQLEQARIREKDANQSAQILVKKLESTNMTGASEVAQGYAQIIRVVQESQKAQADIEIQLNGIDSSALVQEPTLPSKHKESKRWLISILVAQAIAFFIIIYIFVNKSLINSKEDDNTTRKISDIKNALIKAVKF